MLYAQLEDLICNSLDSTLSTSINCECRPHQSPKKKLEDFNQLDKIYFLKRIGLYDFARELKYRSSQSERKRFYAQFVREKELCFDVGANIGNKTEIFIALGAKVVSIEPQTQCVQKLKRKFKKYGDFVTLVPKAVSDSTGKSKIAVSSFDGYTSMSEKWISRVKQSGRFRKSITWNEWQEVETTTLDKLISEYGVPHYVKVDVEGFEPSVFQGLHTAISYISFEFTCPETIEDTFSVVDIIDSLGKYEYNYLEEESVEFNLKDWTSGEELKSFFSSHLVGGSFFVGEVYARLAPKQ
jgi:FkbM family methyltransferase